MTQAHDPDFEIRTAGDADIETVRRLFAEYREWLTHIVTSARLDAEIAALPGPYAPPAGRLLLAFDASGEPLGVIGVLPHEGEACEIKRLYVTPSARGRGVGAALTRSAIAAAHEIGYARAFISTIPAHMVGARAMYADMGFRETERFTEHSHDDVEMLYLERLLP